MEKVEFETQQPAGSKRPPKFKLNKKTIIIGGSILIVAFLVIRAITKSNSNNSPATLGVYDGEYGTASAQGMADSMAVLGQVEAMINESNRNVLETVNDTVGSLAGAVADQFNVQDSRYTSSFENMLAQMQTLNNANKESDQLLQDQLQSLLGSTNELKNGVIENSNKISLLDTIKTPSTDNVSVVTKELGTLATGLFTDKARADRIAKELSSSYGGINTQVLNEGGSYRVVSNYQDQERASAVLNRLVERGAINTGTTNVGTIASNVTNAIQKSLGVLTTQVYTDKARAERVQQELSKSYGATSTKLVKNGSGYSVVGNFADSQRATDVLNRLKERGTTSSGSITTANGK